MISLREEKNIFCFWLLIYGLVFAFFHIIPTILKSFLKHPLTWGDTLDFLTPFVVIPFAYFLYSRVRKILQPLVSQEPQLRKQMVLAKVMLGFGFLLYVDGHGLHLSSNSIARLLQHMKESELFRATYLFDEIISHFMWHVGVFLISIGLIIAAYKISFKSLTKLDVTFIIIGAALYSFDFAVDGIEGQTVIFNFPAAVLGSLLALFLYLKRRKQGCQNPLFLFFAIAYFISALLFAYWGISRSGFPQFSELGWI